MTIKYEDMCAIADQAARHLSDRKARLPQEEKYADDAYRAEMLYIKAVDIFHFASINKCDIDLCAVHDPNKYKYCIQLASQEEVDIVSNALKNAHKDMKKEEEEIRKKNEAIRKIIKRLESAYMK